MLDGDTEIARRSPRPASRVCDVVALLPRPAFVGPPRAVLVAAALGERQEASVRHWEALYRERARRYTVPRKLVVVGEAAVRVGPDVDLARVELDPLGLGCEYRKRLRLPARLSAEEQRLAHRLRVLELVEDDEVVQLARADPLQHVECPCADLLEVLERLLAIE